MSKEMTVGEDKMAHKTKSIDCVHSYTGVTCKKHRHKSNHNL
jgi:hypothetical protein